MMVDDAERAHQTLHTELLRLIDALQARLDRLEQGSTATMQRSDHHGDTLDYLADQSLKQKARIDVLEEELIAIKRRPGIE